MEESIELKIFTKKSFTDKSLVALLSENKSIKITEYSEYIHKNKIFSVLSEECIRFLASYDNGFLRPDKCDAYEPIKEKFDDANFSGPVRWLSQPGGALFCKKARSFDVVLENEDFAPIWENGTFMKPKANEPLFRGTVSLFFKQSFFKKKELNYWVEFLKAFSELVSAEYGFISMPEDFSNPQTVNISFNRIDKLPLNIFLVNYFGEEWLSIFGKRLNGLSYSNDFDIKVDSNCCLILTSLDIKVRKIQERAILKILMG